MDDQLPSGGKKRVIANGVVIDPEVLVEEMSDLDCQLYVSDRAHLVMPQNKALEAALEKARGKSKIGTTLRGIGPTYAVKMLRSGFRVCDLVGYRGEVDRDAFWKKLKADPLFDILEKTYGEKLSREEIAEKYFELAEHFRESVTDTERIISAALSCQRNLLFEAGQGAILDIDMGTYPYVTSSNTGVGSIITGTGVAVWPERIVGIIKAYTTRVGGGPFPTEDTDEVGRHLQEKGDEFGSTTGRPRRCGWIDSVQLKHAFRMNRPTEWVVTKLDVLSGLKTIKVCKKYQHETGGVHYFPARLDFLEECEPVYEEVKGWSDDITGARSLEDLPPQARDYLKRLKRLDDRSYISMISVGPERDQVIRLSSGSL